MNKEHQEHQARVSLGRDLKGVAQRAASGHYGDQSSTRDRFLALGVPKTRLEDGTAASAFSLIGGLVGSMVDICGSVDAAAEWAQTQRWPAGASCSDERRSQMGRMLVFAKAELARLGADDDAILDHLVIILGTMFVGVNASAPGT